MPLHMPVSGNIKIIGQMQFKGIGQRVRGRNLDPALVYGWSDPPVGSLHQQIISTGQTMCACSKHIV